MEYRIIISGFGGQGVLFAGKVVAQAAMLSGYEASWLPSYGPEMRGGTANCQLVISDKPVGSPVVRTADVLIAMNMPSLTKFMDKTNGIIVTDERFAKFCDSQAQVVSLNTDICNGGARFEGLTNMIMLGAMIAKTGILGISEVIAAINRIARGAAAAIDRAAVEYGWGCVGERVCAS